jgi:fatty-acyl-CoA synthase
MTEQDVKDFCKGKIAHFKIPRYVMFVNDFPITISGKIQKFRMRDESIKVLGLEDASKIETA